MIQKELYDLLLRSFDEELNSSDTEKLELCLSGDQLNSEKRKGNWWKCEESFHQNNIPSVPDFRKR